MALVFSTLATVYVKVEYGRPIQEIWKRSLTSVPSIIFVPAIGADPRNTWARQRDVHGFDRLDYVIQDKLVPTAQTHLYDHLNAGERKLALKPVKDEGHRKSVKDSAEAERLLAEFGVAEWGERLLDVVRQHRKLQGTERRPILFICHGTGGTVVKQALSMKAERGEDDITGVCLAVVFFATPHHGSSVLSEPEYVQDVRVKLGLKWDMSETLRQEFTLRNPEIESLNYQFAKSVVGTKVYSFVETTDTHLTVLSTNDSGGEGLTTVRLCITDSRSGKLSTPEMPIEDEVIVHLQTTHVGAPKFMDEDGLYELFLDEMHGLVDNYSDYQRTAFQALNKSIMSNTLVDVHQFYGHTGAMKILSARPSLEDFLEIGPTQCMIDRIRGSDQKERVLIFEDPQEDGWRASAPTAPAVMVTPVDGEVGSPTEPGPKYSTTLSAPKSEPQKSIHTRRPSMSRTDSDVVSTGHLTAPLSTNDKQAQIRDDEDDAHKDYGRIKKPQKTPVFKLPSRSTDRFKWIHVPFNHSGWVPHVLTAISQDKDNLSLHSKLLLDKMWFLQHNRSRHSSPHAHFVKPSVKFLFPEGEQKGPDALINPPSANDDIQFVLYLPYLHWDNFAAMQKRAAVIEKRRDQMDARPVAHDVAHGKSLEHRVIWQYLTSNRPLHCRRTLDQYGYPSLRNTKVRDRDQILYKRTRPKIDEVPKEFNRSKLHGARSTGRKQSTLVMDDGVAKVLMVDQLWLWIIDGQTVVTFFTAKEREEHDNGISRECDIRSAIYQDINGDYASQCSDPFDFAALAVAHAVKALLEEAEDRNLQVFRIFEEYISILTEQQTKSFKEFRDNQRLDNKTNKEIQDSHVDNRRDLDAMLELRDIEDELRTIEKLIREQTSCVQDMLSQYHKLNARSSKGRNGTTFLHDVESFLSDHEAQVREMLKSAHAAQQAFKELLDMKQKQANVFEALLARQQTEVATDQSRSVMIFTIFTIIFLPLSFFASIFGINAKEWSGDGTNYLPLHQIFTYMGAISLAVIFIALLVAFSRHCRRLVQKAWHVFAKPAYDIWQRKVGWWIGHEEHGNANVNVKNNLGSLGGGSSGWADLEKQYPAEPNRLSNLSRSFTRLSVADEDPWIRSRNGSAVVHRS